MTPNTFATLPLAAIVPSLTNPRKTFNPAKLAELTESIKASGVHQPILVRPLPGSRVADTDRGITHEVITGHRRYLAAQSAGLASIPALVCELTDQQVRETQVVENLQRDDLLPLEEAESFGDWMLQDGINAEQVAVKIGKSRQYVANRLNLLALSAECQQALRDGLIDASRASEVARVKDTALQSRILTEAVRKDFRGDMPSVRQLRSWIGMNIMLRLDKAAFDVASSSLITKAGSCSACPKRTGANPDLFADAIGPDLCTDPACFKDKQEAHHTQMMIVAEKAGMQIIAGADAEKICHRYNNNHLTGYSRLTQVRADLTAPGEHLLGTVLPPDRPERVMIENPWTREMIMAVKTDHAEEVLLDLGLLRPAQVKGQHSEDIEGEIKTLKKKCEQSTQRLYREMLFKRLIEWGPDSSSTFFSSALMRVFLSAQVDEVAAADMAMLCGIELLDSDGKLGPSPFEINAANETRLRAHLKAIPVGCLYRIMMLWMVHTDYVDRRFAQADHPPVLLEILASDLLINAAEIYDKAASLAKLEISPDMAKLKAKLKAQIRAAKGDASPAALKSAGITYRGPYGETWSGKGQQPRWVSAYLKGGGSLADIKLEDVAA